MFVLLLLCFVWAGTDVGGLDCFLWARFEFVRRP